MNKTQKRRSPLGFTLVELLVVISIITVLAALLVPAVYYAIQKAKTARIGIELANIEKALERYKIEYGEYPPDFAEVAEATGGVQKAMVAKGIIDNHLARIFRNRNAAIDVPRSSSGSFAPDFTSYTQLNPTNALYFWLKGFSPDPTMPLFGAGDRQPFFEFDSSRLVQPQVAYRLELNIPTETTVAAAYYPQGSLDPIPYIYYRANNVAQFTFGAANTPFTTFNSALIAPLATGSNPLAPSASEPYRAYAGAALWAVLANESNQFAIPVPQPYFSYEGAAATVKRTHTLGGNRAKISALYPYAAPKKFQLISAGMDGMYGIGGQFQEPDGGTGNVRTNTYSLLDKANITNFSGGKTLEDLQED